MCTTYFLLLREFCRRDFFVSNFCFKASKKFTAFSQAAASGDVGPRAHGRSGSFPFTAPWVHLRSGAEVAAFVERNADRTAVVMAAIGAALYPNAAFPQPQGKGKVQWCVGLLQRPPPHAVRTFSHDLSQ